MIKKRKLFSQIVKFLDDKVIIAIHGARQVGKTSLLQFLMEQKIKKIAPEQNILYLDLEDFVLLDICNKGADEAVRYLKSRGADFSRKVFFLIDEIQYLDNPTSFLKLFHDRYAPGVKLIVSGSSSFDIKRKFKETLVGRIIDFELFTLDFEEFLDFKDKRYDLTSDVRPAARELRSLYEEYVLFGGYPAIVLESAVEKKEILLKQIINTYVKKDIRDMAAIRNVAKFNDLLHLLAAQSGSLLNTAELSNSLGLSKQTIDEYLFILESTYVLRRVRPFHRNVRSELTKMPKVFFEDTGMLNILANKTFSRVMSGSLLENSVYGLFRRALPIEQIYFWRLVKGREVDFILEFPRQNAYVPVEVKTSYHAKQMKALQAFAGVYKSPEIFLCSFDEPKDKIAIFPWELWTIIKRYGNEKIS